MKILIVDDHVLVRKGLKALLISCNPTWEVHEAINGIQAIIQAPKLHPDIVLMDYSMPKLNGKRAARQLLKELPGIKIIMISGFISSEKIHALLHTGIMGIVSKTAGTEEILEAIHHVMQGKQHLTVEPSILEPDAEVVPQKRKKGKKIPNPGLLTPRELEVMQLIVTGYNSEMITQQLTISHRTLHVHKANIFKKCNIHSTAELLRYAYKNNLA
ncbi:MAG: response regulator transcription factor [Bacteroidales bacterium]|nr:response regulator transcription factor [Bacteroidales bacterium]